MLKGSAEVPDALTSAIRQATGNRYRIRRRVGSGGMADVYEAEHATLGRPLAVKVMHAHLARDAGMRERFRREAEAASRLVHPLIASPLDYGEAGETVYLVLPFLAGGALADTLTRDRTVPPARLAMIGAQVAIALDHAHRHGVVHRDIKPDNILFDDDGNAFITDFGIATARFHGRLTDGGKAMGTPHYMSPEQASGRVVDGRSDLYAVGVVMYECLAGEPPFDGLDGYAVGYKHVHEAPVPIATKVPGLDAALATIVMRCLAKAPEARYGRGRELAAALLDWMHHVGGPDAALVAATPRTSSPAVAG
ncbi:MAG: serine/threonine protein kinase [Gemmatimonadaceae bacterium]|nr:serine/threonine protein kinase [Gemmatimonadaceae bacterium]